MSELGVTGACPRSGIAHPPPPCRYFSARPCRSVRNMQSRPHGGRASGGQWLACVSKSAGWILMHSQATALPRRGFIKARGGMTAMCGEDDAARHGGAGSKERRELGVVSRSSRAPPPTQENTFRRGAGHRARGDMCVGVAWRSPRPTKRGASAEVDTGP